MPEEPAMDSYQPQADVSHVMAQLTEILTRFFLLQQVKCLFVRKSYNCIDESHCVVMLCHILTSPTTLLAPSLLSYSFAFSSLGAVVR